MKNKISPKLRNSQSVVDMSSTSQKSRNGKTVLLPPLNNSCVDIETTNIRRKIKGPRERFEEPLSVRKLKEIIPVTYLKNFTSFSKSINVSQSNLTKGERWNRKGLEKEDFDDCPSPLAYNLGNFNSISKKAKATNADMLRTMINPNKRYDRFK